MKKAIAILALLLIMTGFFGCASNQNAVFLDNSDKSCFIDFYTEGDKVYIECKLNIYSENDSEVTITALDTDNVEAGLLKTPTLIGIDKTDGDESFTLKSGENEVTVLFCGDYAGVYQIAQREIPRFIKVT